MGAAIITTNPQQKIFYKKIGTGFKVLLIIVAITLFMSKCFDQAFPVLTHEEVSNLNLTIGLNQSDPKLLRHIRKYRLTPPSNQAYNLTPLDTYANSRWTDPVSAYVLKLLKYKLGGFFIEAGANDGEFLSNTLTMELKYGWTGLLVEADPEPLTILRERNRRAWIADVCLATLPYPHTVEMLRHKGMNGVSYIEKYLSGRKSSDYNIKFSAQCFPIFSLLSALGIKVVDYFSLDIEGAELAVLQTFPFDGPILIKVISAEVHRGKEKELTTFLSSKGYRMIKSIQGPYVHDLVFAHSSIKDVKT